MGFHCLFEKQISRMAFKYSDPAKVDGYLIAGLEIQREIKRRHRVFIPLTELHDIVMVYYRKNRSQYQQEANIVRKLLKKEQKPVIRFFSLELMNGVIQTDSEIRQLISKKVQTYSPPYDNYYEKVDPYYQQILFG